MSNLAVVELPKPKDKTRPKRRNPRGMGSVWQPTYMLGNGEKRKSNYYWIRYTDEAGQRHNENSNCTTKDGAREILKDRLNRISKGEFHDFQRYRSVTLKEIGDGLRAQYVTKGRRSVPKLKRSLLLLETHFGPDCPVSNLTAERIEGYRAARRADESKPTDPSINRELAALKAALRLGYKNDLVKKVPHIEIPDESGRAREGEFTPDQFKKLKAEFPARLQRLAQFIYLTGMRVSEPLGLRWSEVDLNRWELRISGRRTKNGEQKVLYLSGAAMDVIRAQHEARNGEFVFHKDGVQIDYWNALDHFQKACRKLKIVFTEHDGSPRQPGWHDLRRTFARNARRAGIADNQIMEVAGWKSHQMLLRYLGSVKESEQRRAFDAMDKFLGKAMIRQSPRPRSKRKPRASR